MNVRSLGDLTRITEQELLSYKNFGETSLNEVKQMMASKGLRLGQALEKEAARPKRARSRVITPSDPRNTPVGELEFSVLSRKCLQALGVQTVGDLCACSEPQLLATKNFGQTSLNEIKQKLAEFNLTLRQE
jgi:DNA-directed RNA polymerase subunit alpha